MPLTRGQFLDELRRGRSKKEILAEWDFTEQQILVWRREDPLFDAEYSASIRGEAGRCEGDPNEEWPERFLACYARLPPGERTIKAGCDLFEDEYGIPLEPGLVYSRRNPASPDYSEAFALRLLRLDGGLVSEIEHTHLQRMKGGEIPSQAQKFLQNHPLTAPIFGERPVEVNVNKRLQIEARLEVRRRIASRSHELVEEEQRLLEGECEEVEDVEDTEDGEANDLLEEEPPADQRAAAGQEEVVVEEGSQERRVAASG